MKLFLIKFVSLCILLLFISLVAPGLGYSGEEDRILYKYNGVRLKDSKWGAIAKIQEAINANVKEKIMIDGIYGKSMKSGLSQVLADPRYSNQIKSTHDKLGNQVTVEIWNKLLTNKELPTAFDRSFALVLTNEGTDYDKVEWNIGTADDMSILTWGPYGATVGHGGEVRAILSMIKDHEEVKKEFGSELSNFEKFVKSSPKDSSELMRKIYADSNKRNIWKQSIQNIGKTEVGRKAYNDYAFKTSYWLKPNFKKLYELIDDPKNNATEIDLAFFMDIGAHASVSNSRISEAKLALSQHKLSNSAERRRIIGELFVAKVNPRWASDRRGRNVVFYADELDKSINKEERDAWNKRTGGLKASNFGLSDERKYYPDFL